MNENFGRALTSALISSIIALAGWVYSTGRAVAVQDEKIILHERNDQDQTNELRLALRDLGKEVRAVREDLHDLSERCVAGGGCNPRIK